MILKLILRNGEVWLQVTFPTKLEVAFQLTHPEDKILKEIMLDAIELQK